MSKKKLTTRLRLTDRALRDISEIESYSIATWGKKTAAKYISELESGLQRVKENPGLLREEPDIHASLRFYRINKHVLVCDVQPSAVFLLTVIHGSRDIPSRLSELEPMLSVEVELLHRKLRRKKKPG